MRASCLRSDDNKATFNHDMKLQHENPNHRRILATAVIALPSALFAIDTDSDGLDDSVETNTGVYVSPTNTGTNPNNPDSDADGAGDWYEVATIDTNPAEPPAERPE